MADKFPYISGGKALAQAVEQFRKSFPSKVTAETLKKLNIAPNNETYLLNILRFIGLIDKDGNQTETGLSIFSKHEDTEFQGQLAQAVKAAYNPLFELHRDEAWTLALDGLVSFFRENDHTGDIVGRRQASTFQALARLSGHVGADVSGVPKGSRTATRRRPKAPPAQRGPKEGVAPRVLPPSQVGLTVRIEVNLPAAADKKTYDEIFRSIRENLVDLE